MSTTGSSTGTHGRPSCRGLGRQPSQLDRESGLGDGSEGDSKGAMGVVDVIFDMSWSMRDLRVSRGCLDEGLLGQQFFSSTPGWRTSLWKRALALRKFFTPY